VEAERTPAPPPKTVLVPHGRSIVHRAWFWPAVGGLGLVICGVLVAIAVSPSGSSSAITDAQNASRATEDSIESASPTIITFEDVSVTLYDATAKHAAEEAGLDGGKDASRDGGKDAGKSRDAGKPKPQPTVKH
jgi:hypothetical protein